MTNSIKQKVISDIRDGRVVPHSVFYFKTKWTSYLVLASLFVFLSSVSFAATLFIFLDQDYDIFEYLDKSFLSYILGVVPYFWIFLIIAFTVLAQYIFSNSRNGFKYSYTKIFLINLLLSILCGLLLSGFGFGNFLHNRLVRDLPWYQNMLSSKDLNWLQPEHGLLSGEIAQINPESLEIKDIHGKTWTVFTGADMLQDENLLVGEKVKFVGKVDSENTFTAYDLRNWTE